jgi:hypothetical protein
MSNKNKNKHIKGLDIIKFRINSMLCTCLSKSFSRRSFSVWSLRKKKKNCMNRNKKNHFIPHKLIMKKLKIKSVKRTLAINLNNISSFSCSPLSRAIIIKRVVAEIELREIIVIKIVITNMTGS